MHFGAEQNIWFLLLSAGVGVFLFFAYRARCARITRLAAEKLKDDIFFLWDSRKERLKYILLFLAVLFTALSLMRPQWGFTWTQVKRRGLDIMVVFDVSKSMLAQDVRPSRLERSKLALRDLLKKLKGDRIGLVAFAGHAYLQCPLTVDYAGFAMALDDLDIETIPLGGTALAEAIRTAEKGFTGINKKYRAIVIITDGEDHDGQAVEAARHAAKEGIKIFCVGIGSSEGELIQVDDGQGGKEFLHDRAGNVVKTRLNEKLLEDIAAAGSGAYVRSSGADFGLDFIYDKKLALMEKGDIQEKLDKRYFERFQIPLMLAFICLLTEAVVTNRKRG